MPKALLNSGWVPAVPRQEVALTGGEFKYVLRTLRMGYLYVLLDKTVWQGYEVTAEGFLRQFNPLAMPEGDAVMPLSQICLTQGHEIAASFINIDDRKYHEAWIAFSSDPWSEEVLAEYLSGKRPASRFTRITLSNGQISGTDGVCIPLDASLSALKSSVAEFATPLFTNIAPTDGEMTGGAHGFYSRTDEDKQSAMGRYVSQLERKYQCGVMAIAVDDSVGIVQELNLGRMQIMEACLAYIAQPEVFHKHMISGAITQYLDRLKQDVAKQSSPAFKMNGPAIGGYGPEFIPADKVAEQTFAQQYARLLKSYDEPARAAFAAEFRQHFTMPERQLRAIDMDLAAWFRSQTWLNIISYDYAPDSSAAGWAAQMLTLAACVQGGAMTESTQDVWAQWLQKADSPAYLGFTGMQISLQDTLFNGGNVFNDLKTAATSDEFGNYLKKLAIQRGWASRILAVTGSVSRLGKSINPATRKSYLAMMQGAMLTAGESTIVLEYNTTLRKLKRHLKENAGLRQSLAKNNPAFENTGFRGGSGAVVDEMMGLRGKGLDVPIKVQFSMTGTLDEIQKAAGNIPLNDRPFHYFAGMNDLDNVFISDLSLQGKDIKGPVLRATYTQMAEWNERGRRLISGDSVGLILGAGLMALQLEDWHAKADAVKYSVGTDVDAVADYAINRLLVLEGMAEIAGFASKLAVKQNWLTLSARQQVPKLVRLGAVLGGIAGIFDGIRNLDNGLRAYKDGDTNASFAFAIGGVFLITGGGVSAYWGADGIYALTSKVGFLRLGPSGWAALLIFMGFFIVYEASKIRSTAFELWLRRTCFGLANESIKNYPLWHASSMTDLAEALVEYRAIITGMVADVAFASPFDTVTGNPTIYNIAYRRVDFRISLPGWVEGVSGRLITLTRSTDGFVLFTQSDNAPDLNDHERHAAPEGYYKYLWLLEEVKEGNGKGSGLKNLNIVVSIWVDRARTSKVTLTANYWPDRAEPDFRLGLELNANRD
ncbi:T6SS effector BTH_I2691 family protein [Erwinia sp. JUb26]|uniref:T6SS effector BTH_I2691 family protein n=1 Tax=Erwinia sp. JUb26 TaxID=2485126 RepID=UPI002711DE22|nr:T6SS effector BTH_I2691 family protein [Erwinia sp. JUb26]